MIKSRPFLVTLVCYYLLLSGTFFLLSSFTSLKDPDTLAAMEQIRAPFALQVVMLYLNQLVLIVCAINMLQEVNWARWVYLGWGFVSIDYNFFTQPDWHNCVMGVAIYLVSALILLLPSANRFFSNAPEYVDA
jgi:hypothetical protein